MKPEKYKMKPGTWLTVSDEKFGGHSISEFNEISFGPEIISGKRYKAKSAPLPWVNLFPSEVNYISVFKFTMSKADKKYACLNSLPPELQQMIGPNGFPATLTLDYPFEEPYTTSFCFRTVNEVLEQIKDGFWKMYGATKINGNLPFGKPLHIIEVLRIECLYYNSETGQIHVEIGS